MLINSETWPQHRPWFRAAVGLILACLAAYALEVWLTDRWPTGSGVVGIIIGVIGAGIIIFEMLLWVRKRLRTRRRLGPAKRWMAAHLWLGWAVLPLAFVHSGWQFGGSFTTLLMILLIIVVASGTLGLILQQVIPSKLLADVPAETIYSQIDRIIRFQREDAARLIEKACQIEPILNDARIEDEEERQHARMRQEFQVVGAMRSVGKVQGRVVRTESIRSIPVASEEIVPFFHDVVEPFLREGSIRDQTLASSSRARAAFQDLRTRMKPDGHALVDDIEEICDQRRQLQTQGKLHAILHVWMWIHLPISIVLMVFLLAHIWLAIRYW